MLNIFIFLSHQLIFRRGIIIITLPSWCLNDDDFSNWNFSFLNRFFFCSFTKKLNFLFIAFVYLHFVLHLCVFGGNFIWQLFLFFWFFVLFLIIVILKNKYLHKKSLVIWNQLIFCFLLIWINKIWKFDEWKIIYEL